MRIDWAIPCRYVEINQGLATMIGAGMNAFTVQELPGGIGLMIALRITAAEGDRDEHILASEVLGPDMQPATERIQAPGLAMGEPNPLKPPGWEESMTIPIGVQFPVEEPGQYTVVLSVDDRTESVPLMVQQAPTV